MQLKGKNIGLVSPGGEIRAYYNAGVLHEFMRRELKITRISGTSGGIICLLPYFQSADAKEFDERVVAGIRRELLSSDYFREALEYFKKKLFHYTLHFDFEVDIHISEDYIMQEFLALTPICLKRMKETDMIVSTTEIKDHHPLQSRRFNISQLCLSKGSKGMTLAAAVIRACSTLISTSEPVIYEENGEKMFLLDGFYSDNIPMREMYEDEPYAKHQQVEEFFVINNSNLRNYKKQIELLGAVKNQNWGLSRYSFAYKGMLRYSELSMMVSASDNEQIQSSIAMNQMLRSKLRMEGRKITSGQKIGLLENQDKIYTLKPFYLVEPQKGEEDIHLFISHKDKETVAMKNYELGKTVTRKLLDQIEKEELSPY
jgi:predicted acylesterase/phospholipase RssA